MFSGNYYAPGSSSLVSSTFTLQIHKHLHSRQGRSVFSTFQILIIDYTVENIKEKGFVFHKSPPPPCYGSWTQLILKDLGHKGIVRQIENMQYLISFL